MKHKPTQMNITPFVMLEVLEDVVELECPICHYKIINFEKNVVFHPYLTICEGVEENQTIEIENTMEIPF